MFRIHILIGGEVVLQQRPAEVALTALNMNTLSPNKHTLCPRPAVQHSHRSGRPRQALQQALDVIHAGLHLAHLGPEFPDLRTATAVCNHKHMRAQASAVVPWLVNGMLTSSPLNLIYLPELRQRHRGHRQG